MVVVENDGFDCYKPAEDSLATKHEPPTPTRTAFPEPFVPGNTHRYSSHEHSSSEKMTESAKTSDTDLEMNNLSLPTIRGVRNRKPSRKERYLRIIGWIRRFSSLSAEEQHLEDEYWKEHWCVRSGMPWRKTRQFFLFLLLGSVPSGSLYLGNSAVAQLSQSTHKGLSSRGLWLVLNWILQVAFARRPFNDLDNIYFYFVSLTTNMRSHVRY